MVNSMSTRMERYKSETSNISRVNKNNDLYESIKSSDLTRIKNNDNVRVIENNGKTIDIAKIKKYLEENNTREIENKKRTIVPKDEQSEKVNNEIRKNYDINSVLENAKKTREIDYDRERYKKLKREEYDILSKLKMYDTEEVPLEKDDFNTEEKTLIDLINTVTIHKGDLNLLEDLMGGEDEETTLPIEEEIKQEKLVKTSDKVGVTEEIPLVSSEELTEKVNEINQNKTQDFSKTKELVDLKEKTMDLENSFYTSSMKFSKEDFEGFDELEKSVKKNSVLTIFLLILLVIFIIATLIVIANYVFELGLF